MVPDGSGISRSRFRRKSLAEKPLLELFDGAVATRCSEGSQTMNSSMAKTMPPAQRTFPFLMLKEIYEQPEAVRKTIEQHFDPATGSVRLDKFPFPLEQVKTLRQVIIAASGSSRHAGLCGKIMIEELAGVPVDVEYASEYGYRRPLKQDGALLVAITQSGETADTIAAQRIAAENGIKTLSISNVLGSTIAREADANVFTYAGTEFAVPATKSFTTQLTALYMFALFLSAGKQTLDVDRIRERMLMISQVPSLLSGGMERLDRQAEAIARLFLKDESFIFLGRGVHYPVALEGALKLKEISYVNAEGYPTGELRHGTTALIDERFPMVAIMTRDRGNPESMLRYEKSLYVLNEVRKYSRRQVLLISDEDNGIRELNDAQFFSFPRIDELLLPILEIVALQLLAYHIAVMNGLDVDHPRNLVKAVTVDG
jgi:glutamine---fructose-6-phosphate transaminase (isomerizing)